MINRWVTVMLLKCCNNMKQLTSLQQIKPNSDGKNQCDCKFKPEVCYRDVDE